MNQILQILSRWENVIGWLAVAWFCKAVLKWSIKDLVAAMMQEAKDAIRLKPTVSGINGMFVAVVFASLIVLAFASTLGRFFGMVQSTPVVSIDPNKGFMGLVICGSLSLVCVLRSR